jgi:ribosomal protein L30/L7E
MTWQLNIIGNALEKHRDLVEELKLVKINRTVTEQEHIDEAGKLFKSLVPRDSELEVYFSATGHAPDSHDIIFSSTCNVYSR